MQLVSNRGQSQSILCRHTKRWHFFVFEFYNLQTSAANPNLSCAYILSLSKLALTEKYVKKSEDQNDAESFPGKEQHIGFAAGSAKKWPWTADPRSAHHSVQGRKCVLPNHFHLPLIITKINCRSLRMATVL